MKRSGFKSRPSRRKPSQPRRDWREARAKVEAEVRCRVCKGSPPHIEAAHVIGREHDEPLSAETKVLWVDPERIVPLCGICHGHYDAHALDLLPYLTLDEQLQAVRDAGGIALALRRISGRPDPKREAA